MKRTRILSGVLFLAALVSTACGELTACNQITNPDPKPTASPSPSPSPSATPVAGNCPPVVVVAVSVEGHPNPLRANVVYRLDASPKDVDREKVPTQCHGSLVEWLQTEDSDAGCTLSGDVHQFNPWVSCSKAGRLSVQACVTKPGGCGQLALDVVVS